MLKYLSAFIFWLTGWKTDGLYPLKEKKLIIVVMHHTSNWDFPIGLVLRNKMGFKANFVMKSSMFKPPFGFIFRWLGGHPVERDPSKKTFSMTQAIIELYNQREELTITFTPEGTRSKVRKLKTGFWTIARETGVPILYVDFDYLTKTVRLADLQWAAPSFREEFDRLKAFFGNSRGKYPEKSFDFEDHDMAL